MSEVLDNLNSDYKKMKQNAETKEEKEIIKSDYEEVKNLIKGAEKLLKDEEKIKKIEEKEDNDFWNQFESPVFPESKVQNGEIYSMDITSNKITDKENPNLKKYLEKFDTDEIELLVKISWVANSLSKIDEVPNYLKGCAEFSSAIDVKTNKIAELSKPYLYLEWLISENENDYYKFEVNKVYHLKLRKLITDNDVHFEKYYVIEVLERDVKNTILDGKIKFSNSYEDNVKELIILTNKYDIKSFNQDGYTEYHLDCIDAIDTNTNSIIGKRVALRWIDSTPNNYSFDKLEIYRVKVRKHKNFNEDCEYYMLVEFVEKCSDERLLKAKVNYLKPVYIEVNGINFELDKDSSCFYGEMNYFERKIKTEFEFENDNSILEKQLQKFKTIMNNFKSWNASIMNNVVNDLIEPAIDWTANSDYPIHTREEFIKRINISGITFQINEKIRIWIDDDDIFTGGGIVLDMDQDGNLDIIGI